MIWNGMEPISQQLSELNVVPEQIWQSGKLSAGGLAEATGDYTGFDSVQKWGKELRTEAIGELEKLRIKDPSFMQEVAQTVGTSVGQAVPLMAAAFVTRSPHIVTTGFGLMEFGRAYGTAREKGIPEDRALSYAAASGLVETATEYLPTKFLFSRDAAPLKRMISFFGSEIVGEETAEVGQRYLEWWGGLSEKPTAGELREIMALTAVATPLGASVQGGMMHAMENLDKAYREVVENSPPPDYAAVIGEPLWQSGYHGTGAPPFSKFDMGKVGTGEGHQAYGWGLYFAESKKVGKRYQNVLKFTENMDVYQRMLNSFVCERQGE
jgi:hypothetical protein